MGDGQRLSDHSWNQSMRNGNNVKTVSKKTTKAGRAIIILKETGMETASIQPWNEVLKKYDFRLFGFASTHLKSLFTLNSSPRSLPCRQETSQRSDRETSGKMTHGVIAKNNGITVQNDSSRATR
jgi:hypothetical protein